MFKIPSLTDVAAAGQISVSQIFGLEMNEERLAIARRNVERANQLARNGALPVTCATPEAKNDESFGQQLAQAAKRLVAQRSGLHRHNTVTPSDDESFGQKLARAARARAASRSRCYLRQ